ncbi:MAG: hypothetical protein LBK74_08555 [Treponema sp.]|jgi:hypothetical protein|nr:hypothetical protein [Treponema sp.]
MKLFERTVLKMKNKLVLVLGVLLVFSFFSCSAQSSNSDQRIAGTWVGIPDYDSTSTITFVFNADGSGSRAVSRAEESEEEEARTFTYGISLGGIMAFIYSDGRSTDSEMFYLSPDGKTMIMDGTVYRKK